MKKQRFRQTVGFIWTTKLVCILTGLSDIHIHTGLRKKVTVRPVVKNSNSPLFLCPSLIFVHQTTNFNSSAICYCTSKWQVILLFLKPTFLYQILMYSPLHIHFFPILLELPNNLLLFVFSVYINMTDFIWWLTLFTVELMQCSFWKLLFFLWLIIASILLPWLEKNMQTPHASPDCLEPKNLWTLYL